MISEDIDYKFFKALVSNQSQAIDFVNTYDINPFVGEVRDVAANALDYIKKYKQTPTKNVLSEYKNSDSSIVERIFDTLAKTDYNSSEYNFYLDKIKQRYIKHKENLLASAIAGGATIKDIEKEIREISIIERPNRKAAVNLSLDQYLPEFHKDYSEKLKNPEYKRGVLTGYSFLDHVTNGIAPSELYIIGGETASGKALPLDTPIPTPDGFKDMADIHPGDSIFGSDGKVYTVIAESEVIDEPGWTFTFTDGSQITSHDNHLWHTFDRLEQLKLCRSKKNGANITGSIRSTKEIANSVFYKEKRFNHAIKIAKAIELPEKELLIDPYVLGVWLGDGSRRHATIVSADYEIIENIINAGYNVTKASNKINKDGTINKGVSYYFSNLITKIKDLNLYKNKYVPDDYLWSSINQRLALLQGLMDTDGYATKTGSVEFCNTNKKLIDAVHFLAVSLGCRSVTTEGRAKLYGKDCGPKWTVRFLPDFPVFRLKRKLDRQKKIKNRLNRFRYICKAERTEKIKMKCIQVSSPDHMYLCGKDFIPTHNSVLLNNLAIQIWLQQNNIVSHEFTQGYNILYFSLEMPYEQCFQRTMCRLADVPQDGLRDAALLKSEAESVTLASKFIKKYPYKFNIVDLARDATIDDIEQQYLESSKDHEVDLVVIDYLGLMDSKDDSDDWLKLGKIAGQVHEFTRAYKTRCITAVQLNRAAKDKAKDSSELVGVHRIGRSSLIMHHANVGIQIESRKDESLRDDFVYHVIKNRSGRLGSHTVRKMFAHAAIYDIPFINPGRNDSGSFDSSFNGEVDISQLLGQANG